MYMSSGSRKLIRETLIVACAAAAISSPAFGQLLPSRVDPAAIAVRAAAATPAVGEEAVREDGVLASAQFLESRTCTRQGCRVFIFDNRSGALIYADGVLSPAFAATGRGRQVIRVAPFTFAEYPQPAPDDKALETAPAIRSVTRVNPD